MNLLLSVIDNHEGLASRRELLVNGVDPGWIDLAAWYGWHLMRVRKGWYARPSERRDVLRDPDDRRRRLAPDAAVIVHWTRNPGPGDRRAASPAHAEAAVASCGVHGAGVARRATSLAAPS